MKTLVKKELRLIWSGWLAVLALTTVVPWLGRGEEWPRLIAPVSLFFGLIILTVDSFGREFSLGTFLSLMSQPMERRQMWRTKISVLACAVGTIFAVYMVNCIVRFHWMSFGDHSEWHWNYLMTWSDWTHWLGSSFALGLIAVSGALWTSLLLRQTAAAFWITFLVPLVVLMGISLVTPEKCPQTVVQGLLFGLAFLYSMAGFRWAHQLFYQAQDVAWSGGVVDFSRWRYFERTGPKADSLRHRRPLMALLKKEFQLHSISLFCTGTLLVLHLMVMLMRAIHGHFVPDSFLSVISDYFWTFWLIVPVVIGCLAVAEERKLGVLEGQFCLPVSRRLQFTLKFFPVIFFGILLGGILPMLLENTAVAMGNPSDFVKDINTREHFDFLDLSYRNFFWTAIVLLAFGLTLISIFASSLARNFLQALGIAILSCVACFVICPVIADWSGVAGLEMNPVISVVILGLAAPWLCVWLAYGNFKYFQERNRLWSRNIMGIAGTFLFAIVLSIVLYNRAWEMLEPESGHGPARLARSNHYNLISEAAILQVQRPDGQVWLGCLDSAELAMEFNSSERPFVAGLKANLQAGIFPGARSAGASLYVPGTNWISVAGHYSGFYSQSENGMRPFDGSKTGYYFAGIQSDGSLWVSVLSQNGNWDDKKIAQAGTETNWSQIVQTWFGVILLKKDGTLWRWNDSPAKFFWNRQNFELNNFHPSQIGNGNDWQELAGNGAYALARRADGNVWNIGAHDKNGHEETNLAAINLKHFSFAASGAGATVHLDGTLWIALPDFERGRSTQQPFHQFGQETNWQSIACNDAMVIALKTDGSLWRSQFPTNMTITSTFMTPTRLGTHDDWVAIDGDYEGVVALAADGSLWEWMDPERALIIKPPRRPHFLVNILDTP